MQKPKRKLKKNIEKKTDAILVEEEKDLKVISEAVLETEADDFILDAESEISSSDESEELGSDLLPISLEKNLKSLSKTSKDIVKYDPLQSYLSEIKNIKPLSREEEKELAVRFHEKGDLKAGYKIVMANLRLVVLIAKEYQRNFQNILDLVQEGNIGLLEAVKKYDPYRGIKFPSYAVYWVRAYMLRYLINNVRLVKVGTTQAQRKLFYNLRKEQNKLEKEGYVPEAILLAERLKVKESEVIEMQQRLALPDLSMDTPLSEDKDSGDFHSVFGSTEESVEDVVLREQMQAALRDALEEFKSTSDEKEVAIIERRLMTEEPVTLQEIADDFKLSRERIRQIESSLKKKIKDFLQQKLQVGEDGEVVIDSS